MERETATARQEALLFLKTGLGTRAVIWALRLGIFSGYSLDGESERGGRESLGERRDNLGTSKKLCGWWNLLLEMRNC